MKNKWLSLDWEDRKQREIKCNVDEWNSSYNKNRRINTVPSWLRIGHTDTTHSYLIQGQTNSPKCERYRRHLTVKHIVECKKFIANCDKYLTISICQIYWQTIAQQLWTDITNVKALKYKFIWDSEYMKFQK